MGSQPNMQINVGSRYTDYSIIDNWCPLRYLRLVELFKVFTVLWYFVFFRISVNIAVEFVPVLQSV